MEDRLGTVLRVAIDDELSSAYGRHRGWARDRFGREQPELAEFLFRAVAIPAVARVETGPLPPNVVKGIQLKLGLIVREVAEEVLRRESGRWRQEGEWEGGPGRWEPPFELSEFRFREPYVSALVVVMSGLCPLWPFCD